MVMKKPCHILALFVIVRIIGSDLSRVFGHLDNGNWKAHQYPPNLGALGVTMFIDDDGDGGPSQGWLSESSSDSSHQECITAVLGQSVVLNCNVEYPDGEKVPYIVQWNRPGDKVPIYIWYAGYPPHVGVGYKDRISLVNQASVNISDVQESDQGWYQCQILFLNRGPDPVKNGTWVCLLVHAPPHFTVTPQEVYYVKLGDSLILPCEADGTPQPTVLWYKDSQPLEPTDNIQLYNNGHEVRVTNLRQEDVASYVCEANNGEGHITHTTKIIIAGGAVITARPKNITKLEGHKAEFICEAKAMPGNITYKWYRNDIDVNELSYLVTRTTKRGDGTLVIDPLTSDDSGKYTCEVFNGIGTPQSAFAYLNVEYRARVSFTNTLQYLPLGLSGVITCQVDANPSFQFITWTKDKRVYKPPPDGYEQLNNGSLFIKTVTAGDQGHYTCTPFNSHGTGGVSDNMEILVREPPKFIIKPQEVYQRIYNSEVVMPCEAKGNPNPSTIWRRADGKKMPRERIQTRGGNLTIKYLRKEDHGYYECVVQNDVATLVTSTLLIVESTTPHAPTNLTVNTTADTALISWMPAYDGGHAQHYVIWYRQTYRGDAFWRTVNVEPNGSTSITVYNLDPNTSYDFLVLSRNILGESLKSEIVKAVTKSADTLPPTHSTDVTSSTSITPNIHSQGKKPAPPRNVTIVEVNDGIKISWLPPVESAIPPSHYMIECRVEDGTWSKLGGPIKKLFHILKSPLGGKSYYFRVYSQTSTASSEPTEEKKFNVPTRFKDKAITAGVVGGILFFIVAIILSICAVKICNKRKRRRQERAYSMVACRVTDVRNGGHGPAGSPVPLRKFTESRVSGVNLSALRRKVTRFTRLALGLRAGTWWYMEESRGSWGLDSHLQPPPPSPKSAAPAPAAAASPPSEIAPMEPARRFPKSVRYQVKMEYSQPAGYISRTADGRFRLYDADEEGFVSHYKPIPSRPTGFQQHELAPHPRRPSPFMTRDYGDNRRMREEVYYGREMRSWERVPDIHTIYSPRDPRFRTSSPGPIARMKAFPGEDLSSVLQPSSAERSFPSTVSSRFTHSGVFSPSYELPSLRVLHENLPYIRGYEVHQPVPQQQQVRAQVHEGYYDYPRPRPVPISWSSENRHSATPQYPLETPRRPPAIHESSVWEEMIDMPPQRSPTEPSSVILPPQVPDIQWREMPQRQLAAYKRIQAQDEHRPLATSSPPRIDRRIARIPPSLAPSSTIAQPQVPVSFPHGGSNGTASDSDERPTAYIREHLQEPVDRGHRSVYRPQQPFRGVVPGSSSHGTGPAQSPSTPTTVARRRLPSSRREDDDTMAGDSTVTSDEPFQSIGVVEAPPNSRISIASAGTASSGRGSKAASLTHSRGDSLQGDLEYSPTSRSSSSGFASRNTSQSQPSPHQVGLGASLPPSSAPPPPPPLPSSPHSHLAPKSSSPRSVTNKDHPGIFPTPLPPLNISTDENYEFDSMSPQGPEGPSDVTQSPHRSTSRPRQSSGSEVVGTSDSELYSSFYPRPHKVSKYDDVEIERRIPALKEEFQQFRRRQQERRRSDEIESEC